MNYFNDVYRLGLTDTECRVTFEAENILDFRLGTGKLRYTKVAFKGDILAISRVGEKEYQMRILRSDSDQGKLIES